MRQLAQRENRPEVDAKLAREFAGGGVDDADVVIPGQEQDVDSSDADVVWSPATRRATVPIVDLVGADPVVGLASAAEPIAAFGRTR